MGQLILMERLMAARSAASAVRTGPLSTAVRVAGGRSVTRSAAAPATDDMADRPAFYFDLACPLSYVVAERVERILGDVDWVPVPGARGDAESIMARADALARAARLPLVWPERFPSLVPRAMRAAAYAAEIGAGPRFALAAFRLAFCGGFDLEKASVLTDVAAAAGISSRDCLAAASEEWRDEDLRATASALSAQGVSELPVIGVEGRWFDGLGGLTEAAAWIRRG